MFCIEQYFMSETEKPSRLGHGNDEDDDDELNSKRYDDDDDEHASRTSKL